MYVITIKNKVKRKTSHITNPCGNACTAGAESFHQLRKWQAVPVRDLCIIHESKGGGQGGPLHATAGPADHRVPFRRAGLDGGGADAGLESDMDQAGGIMGVNAGWLELGPGCDKGQNPQQGSVSHCKMPCTKPWEFLSSNQSPQR